MDKYGLYKTLFAKCWNEEAETKITFSIGCQSASVRYKKKSELWYGSCRNLRQLTELHRGRIIQAWTAGCISQNNKRIKKKKREILFQVERFQKWWQTGTAVTSRDESAGMWLLWLRWCLQGQRFKPEHLLHANF